jgi:hypothetical protein
MMPGFYVVRSLSHTDRQCTWKVLSRCFATNRPDVLQKCNMTQAEFYKWIREQAESWCEFEKSQWEKSQKRKPKRIPEFFVVEIK